VLDFKAAMWHVVQTLAAESGCGSGMFFEPGVHLVDRPDERGPRPAPARRFRPAHPSFVAISLGDGVVVSASRELLPELAPYFDGIVRDQAFEPDRLAAVSRVLRPHGLWIRGPGPRLVCGQDTLRSREVPSDFRLVVEPDPPIERVRELGGPTGSVWPNAVDANQVNGALPTTVLAVAYGEGRVVGVASAAAEAPRLWQIGIDVAAEARGNGLGTSLVAAVARHVLAAGRVPWYAVAPANVRSQRAALAAGFRPAWLEVCSLPVAPAP